MNITFIGIGSMGKGMAENILKKNGNLTIWNRTRDKDAVNELISMGAEFRELSDAAGGADIICLNLTNAEALKAVISQMKEFLRPGTVVADFSTSGPDAAKEMAEELTECGAFFLDCPVSGGAMGARNGTLAIMAGGNEEAYKKALPVLEMCGNNIHRMGESGTGQQAKLINQLLTWVNQAVVCEGMVLADKAGINLAELNEVLSTSWGRSWMLERSMKDFIIPKDFTEKGGTLALMVKDFNLITKMADGLNCRIPITETAKVSYDAAMEAGLSGKDPSVVMQVMEKTYTKEQEDEK